MKALGSPHKRRNNKRRLFFPGLLFLLLLLLVVVPSPSHATNGGELASLTAPQMTPDTNYRQKVCDRYELLVNNGNGTIQWKAALQGLQLNVLMGASYQGAYFNYDSQRGIHPDNPGFTAVLLDELARRAGFTWRNSFGIFVDPGRPR